MCNKQDEKRAKEKEKEIELTAKNSFMMNCYVDGGLATITLHTI